MEKKTEHEKLCSGTKWGALPWGENGLFTTRKWCQSHYLERELEACPKHQAQQMLRPDIYAQNYYRRRGTCFPPPKSGISRTDEEGYVGEDQTVGRKATSEVVVCK
jgi:hypothetical protein